MVTDRLKILGAMYTRYSTTAFKEFYYTILNYIVVIDLLLGSICIDNVMDLFKNIS